jgi:hypothetical protein
MLPRGRGIPKRLVTTAHVLDGHVSLDTDCSFLALRGFPIPSPAVVGRIGDGFRRSVRSFADANQILVIRFGKGDRKLDRMRPYLARQERAGRSWVPAIGWAGRRTPSDVV